MIVVAGDLSLVGGRDYPRTYQKFRSWFPDEWTCLRCSSRPLAPTRTPSPSSSAAPATTGTTPRRLSVNCTQADMQDVATTGGVIGFGIFSVDGKGGRLVVQDLIVDL